MMKPAKTIANRIVLDDAAPGIAMTVTPQGTAGWLVSLVHAETANLAAGLYGIDARLTLSGAVGYTTASPPCSPMIEDRVNWLMS